MLAIDYWCNLFTEVSLREEAERNYLRGNALRVFNLGAR